MPRSSMFPRSAAKTMPPGGAVDAAGMVEAARSLAASLPDLAHQAEAGGLQLVAQHLNKALQLARRVADAGTLPPPLRP